jgi:hypothetical protein
MDSRPQFSIGIEHTRYVFPEDPSLMQHGQAGVVDLRGTKKAQMLRGRVAQDIRDSTIKTREYGVKSHFYADLRKLTAKSAPELSWLMDTQLAEARRKLAGEVARDAQLMNRQLNSPQPQPTLPSMPARAKATPEESRALEAELAKSDQRDQRASASQQLRAALSRAQEQTARVPTVPGKQVVIPTSGQAGFPGSPLPPAPKVDTSAAERELAAQLAKANTKSRLVASNTQRNQAVESIPSAPNVNTAASERELKGQLARAKGQIPLESRIGIEMESAKRRGQSVVSQAQPAMNAIMTSLRAIPHRDVPATATAEPADDDLASQPILKEVRESGAPSGTNTVEITVLPNHHLTVRLTQPGNAAFDRAMLKAYQSLDGNPALEYPPGSRRSSIIFLIDNKHKETGVPSSVRSQTSVGDKETVRHHN